MYGIDTADTVASEPARPAAGTAQYWQDTDPAGGTIVPAWYLNMVQKELLAVLSAASITPDKTNDGQLQAAIAAQISGAGAAEKVHAWAKFDTTGTIAASSGCTVGSGTNTFTVTFPTAGGTNYSVVTRRPGAPAIAAGDRSAYTVHRYGCAPGTTRAGARSP